MLRWQWLLSALVVVVLTAACGASDSAGEPAASGEQGATPVADEHAGHAMPASDEVPYDATFIDGMIEHHVGAIEMAEEVLANSERPELLALANEIIAAQTTEVEQMQAWRAEWFPDLAPTEGMAMDMGDMSISTDESVPFDQRFLVAMISHHEGALHMAEDAKMNSEREEIRALADEIVVSQTAEIEQMRAWLAEWFGVTE